jgi:hypothetical protein
MADLQAAFIDDDALDHQLQDGLLVGEARILQSRADASAECRQVGPHRLRLRALVPQPLSVLLLALQAKPLFRKAMTPLNHLGQGNRASLVGVEQALVGPVDAVDPCAKALVSSRFVR